MLNFNHLYYFHVVAAEGSIKGAADRLGVSQSTVSEQVRALERSLGVTLFDRTANGLRPTQAGRDAYEHTSHMFLAGQRLAEALGARTPAATVLRVGVSAAISRTLAADFLLPVLALDRCRPSIRTADFNDLLHDLRTREIDLAIGETEPLPGAGGLECQRIYRPALAAIVGSRTEVHPAWENLALLEYRAASAFHWEVDAFLRERGLAPTCAGELDDAFLMTEAVRHGGFVAFVPRSIARAALADGSVKTIATLTSATTGVYAVTPATDTLDLARAAVNALVENARATAAADPG